MALRGKPTQDLEAENERLLAENERLMQRLQGLEAAGHGWPSEADLVVEAQPELRRLSEWQLGVVFESMQDGIVLLNSDFCHLEANQAAAELYGVPRRDIPGRPITDFLEPGFDLAKAWERFQCDGCYKAEHRIVRPDGSIREVEALGTTNIFPGQHLFVMHDVTGKTVAEQALRESEQRFRGIFENAAVGIGISDPEGRWLQVNQTFSEITGYTIEELLRMRMQDLTHPEDLKVSHVLHERLLRGEIDTYSLEKRYVRKGGGVLWVRLTRSVRRDEAGRPLLLIAAIIDISDLKRTEEALRQSTAEAHRRAAEAEEGRRILDALMQYLPMGITVADAPDVRIRLVSRLGRELAMRPASEIENMPLAESPGRTAVYHPDGVTPARLEEMPLVRAIREGAIIQGEEWVYASPDGMRRPIFCTAGPILDEGGRITGGIVAWQDLTARKKAEEAREAHLAQLGALMCVSQGILAETTIEGVLQRAVEAARELTGATVGVVGRGYEKGRFQVGASSCATDIPYCPTVESLCGGQEALLLDLFRHRATIRLSEEQLQWHPEWGRLPDPQVQLHGLLGARLVDRDDRISGFLVISGKPDGDFSKEDEALISQLAALTSLGLRHIEARREAEQRADELDAVFASMTEAVIVAGLDGRVVRANPTATAFLGFDPVGLDPKVTLQRVSVRTGEGRPMRVEELPTARAMQGETVRNERLIIRMADGREFVAETSASPLRSNGHVAGVVAVWHDATERERLLREIQTLNTALQQHVGELRDANRDLEAFSYSVSHDLRSPLSIIDGYSELLMEDFAERVGDDGREYIETIRESTRRMGGIIEGLLAFSRAGRQEMRQDRIDMAELAQDVFTDAGTADPTIGAAFDVGPLPAARGDWRLIRQVLANLVGNAIKFSRRREAPLIEVRGHGEMDHNVYAIRDNGVGFDMAHATKLFGVFQRLHTPDQFEGTGLGLAIVRRILERHGGRIWAESKPGEGATFYFTLPPAE